MSRILYLSMLPVAAIVLGMLAFLAAAGNRDVGDDGRRHACAAVLTGHPARLEAGARMLREKRVDRLLISGSVEGADPQLLDHIAALAGPRWACCAEKSKWPASTADNAVDIGRWALKRQCPSVALITDRLHAGRVEQVMQRTEPKIDHTIYAIDLREEAQMSLPVWILRGAREYLSFVATVVGLQGTSHPSGPSGNRP